MTKHDLLINLYRKLFYFINRIKGIVLGTFIRIDDMEITEVKVFPAKETGSRLKAYATLVFDACFIIRDLKIIEGDKGLFVSMPSRRRKDGTFRDIVHPLNAETRKKIEEKVVEEYNRVAGTAEFAAATEEE